MLKLIQFTQFFGGVCFQQAIWSVYNDTFFFEENRYSSENALDFFDMLNVTIDTIFEMNMLCQGLNISFDYVVQCMENQNERGNITYLKTLHLLSC